MRTRINGPVLALPLVFVVLHAGCWFAMLASDTLWVNEWKCALDYAAGSVIIVGPLVASISAATYAARRRTSLPVLAVTTVRPVRGWYDPALRLWAVSAASLLALVVEVTLLALAHGLPVAPRQLMIVPFAGVMLLVHALLGAAVGLRARPLLAAPSAGVLSFGLFVLATQGRAPGAFITGGSTDSLAGEQYRTSAVVVLTVVAVLIAVAVAAPSGWWRFGPLAVVAVALALASSTLAGRYAGELGGRIEVATVHFRCAGDAPQVCVAAETPRILPEAALRLHALAAPLRAIGVSLPKRWKESLFAESEDRTAGYLDLSPDSGTRISTDDALGALTMPARCAGLGAREPERSIEARFLLENWLGVRNGFEAAQGDRTWIRSPSSEAWVRSTYRLLRECRLAELRTP